MMSSDKSSSSLLKVKKPPVGLEQARSVMKEILCGSMLSKQDSSKAKHIDGDDVGDPDAED